jgi:hypothetical protein
LAIEPPDKDQPYAEVARKHLAELVLGKYVVVRYTGIGSQGYLVGRILLEQADINAQMLRDGVAWFYQPEEANLSESERQLYPACEQAARAEKRGLWQDNEPLSPWVFRKRAELKLLESTQASQASSAPAPKMDGLALSRKADRGPFLGPPVSVSALLEKPAPTIPIEKWNDFAMLAGPNSTVLVPSGGLRNAARVPIAEGRTLDYASYAARSGNTLYVVLSSKVERIYSETDESAMDGAVESFLATLRREYLAAGRKFNCARQTFDPNAYPYDFYRHPYHARKYEISDCTVSGKLFIYSIAWLKWREVHLIAALSLDGKEDPDAKRFFKSLKIRVLGSE